MGEAFERVVREYCRRNGVDAAACAFTFDGERLGQHLTPAQLELRQHEAVLACAQGALRAMVSI